MVQLLVVTLASLVLLAAAIELASRIWLKIHRGYFVFSPGARRLFHLDAEMLPQLPGTVNLHINSDGERGDEFVAAPDTFRVLIAGGSAAQALFTDQASTWHTVMKRELEKHDALRVLSASRVHVGSIGLSGIHSKSVLLILQRVLPRYRKLDAIVLMLGAGDPLRWVAGGAPLEGVALQTTAECFDVHPEHDYGFALRSSATLELARRLRARLIIERRDRVGRWIGRARAQRNAPVELRETITDPSRMIAAYERNTAEIIALARSKARYVLFARQPWYRKDDLTPEESALFWNFGVETEKYGESSAFYSHAIADELLTRIDASSSRLARQARIGDLDVKAALPPSPSNYYDQFHFTPEGNRIVGKMVAERLLELVSGDAQN